MEYQGWTLFDDVLIVAKKETVWDFEAGRTKDTGRWQGYVVDPSNKTMKENALRWAEACKTKYDENGKFCGYDKTPGEEFLYKNEGFRLQLLETAKVSSQGGKLSFWNCIITAPDKKEFKIGIAADLLLELLMQTVFDRGFCTSPLCFARCKGGVGMLDKDSESYQQALSDMERKKTVKSSKTSKHSIGHVYSSLTQTDIYAADLYSWYEPIKELVFERVGWGGTQSYTKIVGFKRRTSPVKLFWFPHADGFKDTGKCKLSKLKLHNYNIQTKKLPARVDEGPALELDVSIDTVLEKFDEEQIKPGYKDQLSIYTDYAIGLGSSPDSYELPNNVRKALLEHGYRIED